MPLSSILLAVASMESCMRVEYFKGKTILLLLLSSDFTCDLLLFWTKKKLLAKICIYFFGSFCTQFDIDIVSCIRNMRNSHLNFISFDVLPRRLYDNAIFTWKIWFSHQTIRKKKEKKMPLHIILMASGGGDSETRGFPKVFLEPHLHAHAHAHAHVYIVY